MSHAGFPPWATDPNPDLVFPTAQETYQRLQLDQTQWIVETVASQDREATGPDGQAAVLQDAVVKLRRASR